MEEPLELELEVACFLRGSMENSEEEDEKVPPEPPVKEFHRWVPWKMETCKTSSWWRELVAVPEVEDHKRLAQEVWASFWLPRRMSELHPRKDYCQAPPVLPCLLWKKFMPPASSIYACRNIQEIPWEKMVAYAQALQHWVEKTDLPAVGKPCLLAESVRKLREELKCYLSFSNEEVFKGLALPEEMSTALVEEAIPQSKGAMPTSTLKGGAVMRVTEEPAVEKTAPRFLGWEKVLHLS